MIIPSPKQLIEEIERYAPVLNDEEVLWLVCGKYSLNITTEMKDIFASMLLQYRNEKKKEVKAPQIPGNKR